MQDQRNRRPYGSGALRERTRSKNGPVTWYGEWHDHGKRVSRAIGPKRQAGQPEGLTRSQAEAALRQMMASVAAPSRRRARDRRTVEEVGALYVKHLMNAGRKRSTVAVVNGHLKHWHVPFFADRGIDSIRAADVADLIALMREGKRPGGLNRSKPLSPKTTSHVIGTLRAVLAFARRRGWVTGDPLAEISLPASPLSQDIRFFTADEVRLLANAAIAGPYQAIDRALSVTAAMTGLREGELVALRWRDVDWLAGRVRVRQNYVLGEFGTPKSRRSSRSVPMADDVAVELERLSKVSRCQEADDLVFADPLTGGPLGKPQILRRFRAALKAAGLDETHRFHDLRHTFGTTCAAAGVAMRTIQEWMGHRDFGTTLIYSDYCPSAHEADWIKQAFAGTGSAAEGEVHAEEPETRVARIGVPAS
jgi:integrase